MALNIYNPETGQLIEKYKVIQTVIEDPSDIEMKKHFHLYGSKPEEERGLSGMVETTKQRLML